MAHFLSYFTLLIPKSNKYNYPACERVKETNNPPPKT